MTARGEECHGICTCPLCRWSEIVAGCTITRTIIYRSRLATGPGIAWNYRYDVADASGSPIAQGVERLSIARVIARRGAV